MLRRTLRASGRMSGGRDDVNDLGKYTPSKIGSVPPPPYTPRGVENTRGFENSAFLNVDFGSPIRASPANLTPGERESMREESEESEDRRRLFRNKGLCGNKGNKGNKGACGGSSSYFEENFSMARRVVKRGKGWGEKRGALEEAAERVEEDGEDGEDYYGEEYISPAGEKGKRKKAKKANKAKKAKKTRTYTAPPTLPVVCEQRTLGIRAAVSPGGTVLVTCTKEQTDDEGDFEYDSDGEIVGDYDGGGMA